MFGEFARQRCTRVSCYGRSFQRNGLVQQTPGIRPLPLTHQNVSLATFKVPRTFPGPWAICWCLILGRPCRKHPRGIPSKEGHSHKESPLFQHHPTKSKLTSSPEGCSNPPETQIQCRCCVCRVLVVSTAHTKEAAQLVLGGPTRACESVARANARKPALLNAKAA